MVQRTFSVCELTLKKELTLTVSFYSITAYFIMLTLYGKKEVPCPPPQEKKTTRDKTPDSPFQELFSVIVMEFQPYQSCGVLCQFASLQVEEVCAAQW